MGVEIQFGEGAESAYCCAACDSRWYKMGLKKDIRDGKEDKENEREEKARMINAGLAVNRGSCIIPRPHSRPFRRILLPLMQSLNFGEMYSRLISGQDPSVISAHFVTTRKQLPSA